MNESSPTGDLAEFVADWKGPLSTPAREEVLRALIDITGVILVGSDERSSKIAAESARADVDRGPSAVFGQGFRTSPTNAAFVNGIAGHALDFDDIGDAAGGGHRTVCVAPAAIAAAEAVQASGAALMEGVAVGFEVICRLGHAAGGENSEFYKRGFHGTSVFGVFGATAAAARILRLDRLQVANAFGIAASGPKGLRVNYGTMTKPFHAGDANRAGVLAAFLARSGFDASGVSIEGRFGWADAVTAGDYNPDKISNGLGERLAIEDGIVVKEFPTCAANDAPLRAVLRLVRDNDIAPDEVERIEIAISANVLDKTLIVDWPTNGLQGKFSLAFNVVAALVDRRITVATFDDGSPRRLEPYRDRIKAIPVAGRPPVEVRLVTTNGKEFATSEATRATAPLSDDELKDKFRSNVTVVRSIENADQLLALIDGLSEANSIREWTDACC